MVLCRLTAPLVSLAFALIASGISAKVMGRDIGKGLTAFIRRAVKMARKNGERTDLSGLVAAVEALVQADIRKLMAAGGDEDDARVVALSDKAECIKAIIRFSDDAETIEDILRVIGSLFSEGRASVTLCTVHRAKGLQGDRIFILQEEKMPLPFAKRAWQHEQEMNLRYVALTRSTDKLFFIR